MVLYGLGSPKSSKAARYAVSLFLHVVERTVCAATAHRAIFSRRLQACCKCEAVTCASGWSCRKRACLAHQLFTELARGCIRDIYVCSLLHSWYSMNTGTAQQDCAPDATQADILLTQSELAIYILVRVPDICPGTSWLLRCSSQSFCLACESLWTRMTLPSVTSTELF